MENRPRGGCLSVVSVNHIALPDISFVAATEPRYNSNRAPGSRLCDSHGLFLCVRVCAMFLVPLDPRNKSGAIGELFGFALGNTADAAQGDVKLQVLEIPKAASREATSSTRSTTTAAQQQPRFKLSAL